ncbi:MAG TPA: hypothetical protein H9797_01750 [Candidatus Gallimonas gallistercoris]|uniref:Uncharacterized protein n=1 Tax=Candidatus Gallimonas gallistercoris TaxID=2838602 RepID=A0A9D2H226_9FIRM|nr:hypothetical protein [Candidatus Gallimonas gallistercoris]
MNILAERQKGAVFFAVGWMLAGVFLFAAGVFALATGVFETSAENSGVEYCFLVLGGALIVWGAVMLFLVLRTPKTVAVLKGETLEFCGKEYALSAIESVLYRNAYTIRLFGRPYGRLTLVFKDGTRVSASYVADVRAAAEKIDGLLGEDPFASEDKNG